MSDVTDTDREKSEAIEAVQRMAQGMVDFTDEGSWAAIYDDLAKVEAVLRRPGGAPVAPTPGTAGRFDERGNAVVGNIAIPASHVAAFRSLLAPFALTREAIAQAIHDGPNAQAQYAKVGIGPHSWAECPFQEQYLEDADTVLALFGERREAPHVTDRDLFIAELASALGWSWEEAPGVPSSEDVVSGVFDALRDSGIMQRREDVQAEALEAAADATFRFAYSASTHSPPEYRQAPVLDMGVRKWLRARAANIRNPKRENVRPEGDQK